MLLLRVGRDATRNPAPWQARKKPEKPVYFSLILGHFHHPVMHSETFDLGLLGA